MTGQPEGLGGVLQLIQWLRAFIIRADIGQALRNAVVAMVIVTLCLIARARGRRAHKRTCPQGQLRVAPNEPSIASEIPHKQLSPRLYALIIGINSYYHSGSKVQELSGAVADADAIAEFLTDDLKVPSDHIINLRNESATREAIIKAMEGLSQDTGIEEGCPILIYFAGYGGQADASARWTAKTGADKIDVICPYDQGMVKSNETVYPIPNRTVHALLNKLAHEKGDNITLIFDSCHSASANRQQSDGTSGAIKTIRARGAEIAMEIPDDIDHELIAGNETRPEAGGTRGALPLYEEQTSHVFLAACGSKELAWEEGCRGLFTASLLATIRQIDADNITYENLLAVMPRLSYNQNPHCSGVHKSRVLFNARAPTRQIKFRTVEKDQEGNWILGAGASAGVMPLSVWALHAAPTEKSEALGTLCASKPKASSTLLEPRGCGGLGPIPEGATRLYARQVQAGNGHEMKVYYTSEAKQLIYSAGSDCANPTVEEFIHITVGNQEEADMVVGVYREHPGSVPEITFTPNESPLQRYHLPLLTKRVAAKRDEVDIVLSRAAEWNWSLKYSNPSEPACRTLSLRFLKLGDSPEGPINRQAEDLNRHGVATIHVQPGEEPVYGIKLINHIAKPLYARVLGFDVPNFSILELGPHSTAHGQKHAEIQARGEYLVGDTADGDHAITFCISEPQKVELAFIKVVWSTSPFELDTQGETRAVMLRKRETEVWGTQILKLVLQP